MCKNMCVNVRIFPVLLCACHKFRMICLMCVWMVQNLHHSLYFPGVHWIHSRLLAMGVDSANFVSFMGTVGEMHKIWPIRSNFLEFSADGQESEIMEVMWLNFVVNFT